MDDADSQIWVVVGERGGEEDLGIHVEREGCSHIGPTCHIQGLP